MALTTNLPPQAYTRDTLVKAIEWLSSQPASVREKATSADLVVSFYLQARRKAAVQMEAPVSGENFKADLRHLAEDLKQFEEPSAPPTPPSVVHLFSAEPIFKPEPVPQSVPRSEPPVKPASWPVDNRSLAAARELQQRLNLSSEVEALRMLVTMGAERARALFP